MILDEIEALVARKAARKSQSESERLFWRRIRNSIGQARAGLLGRPYHYRHANEDDMCRWALNCALLINGLSPSWMPLLPNRKNMAQMKAAKARTLPRAIHNWMLLAPQNESTYGYACLLEGRWRMGGPETKPRK
jgi:hypothetical protein